MNYKVLYLTYDGLSDPLGQSQVLPYIFGLHSERFKFTIISFEKSTKAQDLSELTEVLSDEGIEWIPLKYTKKPPVLSTIYDLFKLYKKVSKKYSIKKFDIVHCRSYITSLIGLRLKQKFNVQLIFDMRGFWADERVDGNIWNIKKPIFKIIYSYFKKKEKAFLSHSDHVISLTHAGKRIIENEISPSSHAPIQVIPCCVDNDHFNPSSVQDKEKIRSSVNIPKESMILGYVGSIGTWYMLSEMVDFYATLVEQNSQTVFLFVTKEPKKTIEEEFNRRGISTDRFRIISASRQEVPSYISIMNWSIFFIKPVFSKQASSPTKQGEIMSMGIPIICNNGIGDTNEIIEKYKSGVSTSEFSKQSYKDVISQLFTQQYKQEDIRKGSIDYFGLNKGIASYLKVYESCISNANDTR